MNSSENRKKVILVVEDEGIIRMMICDELEEAGFEVLQADHAEEALKLLEDHSETVQALFTDVMMPGAMDGLGLAHKAKELYPHVALVIASGHANPTDMDLPQPSRFFTKPYDVARVVSYIKDITKVD